MVLIRKFKVLGHSMEPSIKNNQMVLVSGLPYLFYKPKLGDIVAFNSGNKAIIKRIIKINTGNYLVQGDNKSDTKNFGWIKKEIILGKMIGILPI